MANILIAEKLDKFTKNLNKYHNKMHEDLECIINLDDFDEAFRKMSYIIGKIRVDFDVTYQGLLKYTGLSKNYFPSWNSILYADKNQRYKIVKYLRSILYSGKFSCIPKDKFGRLIEMLMMEFGSEFKRKQLAKIVGVSQNDIGKIENGERAFSAEKQKEILTFFYNSCFDDMNFRKYEFDAIRKFLYNLLGKDLCTHEKRFYDIYFSFCNNPDEEKDELSELSGISLIDTEGIFSEEDFPYYPNKLDTLSCLMLNRSKEIIQTESLNREDRWNYHLLIRRFLDKSYNEEQYEEYQETRTRQTAEWFSLLPDILKDIVFEFILKQFETTRDDFFHLYITGQGENNEYSDYEYRDKFFLIRRVVDLFGVLSREEKQNVLAEFRKELSLNLVSPFFERNVENIKMYFENAIKSCGDCALFSFYMSSLVGDKTLSEKYKDAPVNNSIEATLYNKKRYEGLWPIEFVDSGFLEKMLNFTADEWQIVGYMELAVLNSFPLNKIFGLFYSQVCGEDGIYDEARMKTMDIIINKAIGDSIFEEICGEEMSPDEYFVF